MKNIKLSFVRHGYAFHNDKKIYHELKDQDPENVMLVDTFLTRKGEEDCIKLEKKINSIDFTHVYSSPLRRTIQTSNNIISNKIIILHDLLAEHPSDWNYNKKHSKEELTNFINNCMLSRNEYNLSNIDDSFNSSKDGEIDLLKNNIVLFIDFISKNHNNGDSILIIGHAWWLGEFMDLYNLKNIRKDNKNDSFSNCELREYNLQVPSASSNASSASTNVSENIKITQVFKEINSRDILIRLSEILIMLSTLNIKKIQILQKKHPVSISKIISDILKLSDIVFTGLTSTETTLSKKEIYKVIKKLSEIESSLLLIILEIPQDEPENKILSEIAFVISEITPKVSKVSEESRLSRKYLKYKEKYLKLKNLLK